MNAKKLPSGSWRARAYDKETKTTKSFTAKTKKEAEFLASEWLLSHRCAPTELTVEKAIDRYLESKNNTLSPSTLRGYRIIQRNALGSLRDVRLDRLTELKLQTWANENAAKYSAKSIKNQFGLLSAI